MDIPNETFLTECLPLESSGNVNSSIILHTRVVNTPTSSDQSPARTRKQFRSPNHARKNPKVKLGLKNLAMVQIYFDDIFVHPRQKVGLRPELSPKSLSNLDPNQARTRKTRPNLQLCYTLSMTYCDNLGQNEKILHCS